MLLAGAAGAAGAAAPAAAASQTVTITATGFVPKDAEVLVGEQVTFANADAVVHQVEFKPATGVTCTASPMLVQPATSQSCTFTVAGNYAYSDPNQRGGTFRGTVSVTAAAGSTGTVTLAASRALVVYGAKVTLTGKISPAKGGVAVDLLARPYPETGFAKSATVVTAADGSFAFALPPQIRTEYRVRFADGALGAESPVVTVQVRPRVTLAVKSLRGTTATLRTGVVSTVSYADRPVLVQRRNSQGGWTTVKTVRLGQFSARTFGVKAPSGTSRWRVYLQASQAGGGYVASYSPTRTVRR